MRKTILQSKGGRKINTVESEHGLRRKSRIPWNGVCEIPGARRGLIRRLLLSLNLNLNARRWRSQLKPPIPYYQLSLEACGNPGGHKGSQGWAPRAGLSLLLVKRLVDILVYSLFSPSRNTHFLTEIYWCVLGKRRLVKFPFFSRFHLMQPSINLNCILNGFQAAFQFLKLVFF